MQRIPMLVVADAGPLIALAVSGVLPASVGMLGGLLVPEPFCRTAPQTRQRPARPSLTIWSPRVVARSSRRPALRRWMPRPVIGSGAVLAQLKRQGLIDSVQAVIEAWKRHGYFVSQAVQSDILLRSGEG